MFLKVDNGSLLDIYTKID